MSGEGVTDSNVIFHIITYRNVTYLFKTFLDPHFIHDMWRAVDESFKKLGISLRILFISENSEESTVVPGCITCSISPLLFSKPESYSIHISSQKV